MNISKYYRPAVDLYPGNPLYLILLLLLSGGSSSIYAESGQTDKITILPFEIVDHTPVPGGEARNDEMLEKLTQFITGRMKEEGIFKVVPHASVQQVVDDAQLGTYIRNCNRCEYDLAKEMGSDKVMTGWIYKMSILVLTMHIEIKDVDSERILIKKAYDFRGDNEKSWLRAANYMVRDLRQMMQM
ncbi:MAG: DUF3280 domain-containing protein [Candidatus Thiodiazotropha taylori]